MFPGFGTNLYAGDEDDTPVVSSPSSSPAGQRVVQERPRDTEVHGPLRARQSRPGSSMAEVGKEDHQRGVAPLKAAEQERTLMVSSSSLSMWFE